MKVKVKDLYLTGTPFSVIVANEFEETIYSILFRSSGIKTVTMDRECIDYFKTVRSNFKKIPYGQYGNVYEFKNFANKLDVTAKASFLSKLNRGII